MPACFCRFLLATSFLLGRITTITALSGTADWRMTVSEVKRYWFQGLEVVESADYDAAQSELAALREELGQTEAERDACLLMEATLRKEKEALIEDRARFPDRPDFIGGMISAHIGNLKAGKESSDNYARNYILKNQVLEQRLTATEQRNAVLMQIIGNAFERLVCITPRNKPSGFLKQQAMDILQSAALKPTESGASDYLESCKAADEALRTKP